MHQQMASLVSQMEKCALWYLIIQNIDHDIANGFFSDNSAQGKTWEKIPNIGKNKKWISNDKGDYEKD